MSIETPLTIYGYNVIVPEEGALDFIRDLFSINDTLIEPIQVYCITSQPDINEIQVIIGFIPDDHLPRNMIYLDTLREFIMDNPMFDEVNMNEKPGFYAGFIWKDDALYEVESEESEESEDTEESEESDTSDSDDDETNDNETDDKPTSYYISKYYI